MNRIEMAEKLESWAKELRDNRLVMPIVDITAAEAYDALADVFKGFEITIEFGKSCYDSTHKAPTYSIRGPDYKTIVEDAKSLRAAVDAALDKHAGKDTTLAELQKQLGGGAVLNNGLTVTSG